LNIGTRASRKFIVRKWRQSKSFVLKNTMKLLLKIMNGIERATVETDDRMTSMVTASHKEDEKAQYFESVGIRGSSPKISPTPSPIPPKPVQANPKETTSTSKPVPITTTTPSSGKKKKTSATGSAAKAAVSTKPSIMDQLAGALSSPKVTTSKGSQNQVSSDLNTAEPNALSGMFSSLMSLGLYAAGGAAIVGYFVYSQYDFWWGGAAAAGSSSSETAGTTTTAAEDEIVNMEVDIVSATTTIKTSSPPGHGHGTGTTTRRRMVARTTAVTPETK
jgi:hypothetical protein